MALLQTPLAFCSQNVVDLPLAESDFRGVINPGPPLPPPRIVLSRTYFGTDAGDGSLAVDLAALSSEEAALFDAASFLSPTDELSLLADALSGMFGIVGSPLTGELARALDATRPGPLSLRQFLLPPRFAEVLPQLDAHRRGEGGVLRMVPGDSLGYAGSWTSRFGTRATLVFRIRLALPDARSF
jgi:hypothetical protein